MSPDRDILFAVLEAREERVNRRNELLALYEKPVITVSLNIPGPDKGAVCYEPVFNILWNLLITRKKEFKIEYTVKNKTPLGYEGFIVSDREAVILKKSGLSLEAEHPLGVLFDIDVTDADGIRISREDLGFSPRPCIVCKENPAFLCIRGKKHTLEDTLNIIHTMIGEYFLHKGAVRK